MSEINYHDSEAVKRDQRRFHLPEYVSPFYQLLIEHVDLEYKELATEKERDLITSIAYTQYSREKKDVISDNANSASNHDDPNVKLAFARYHGRVRIYATAAYIRVKSLSVDISEERLQVVAETEILQIRAEIKKRLAPKMSDKIRDVVYASIAAYLVEIALAFAVGYSHGIDFSMCSTGKWLLLHTSYSHQADAVTCVESDIQSPNPSDTLGNPH